MCCHSSSPLRQCSVKLIMRFHEAWQTCSHCWASVVICIKGLLLFTKTPVFHLLSVRGISNFQHPFWIAKWSAHYFTSISQDILQIVCVCLSELSHWVTQYWQCLSCWYPSWFCSLTTSLTLASSSNLSFTLSFAFGCFMLIFRLFTPDFRASVLLLFRVCDPQKCLMCFWTEMQCRIISSERNVITHYSISKPKTHFQALAGNNWPNSLDLLALLKSFTISTGLAHPGK